MIVGAVALIAGGCARIVSSTEYSETLVSRKTSTHTVAGTLRYTVAPELDGQVLTVTIRRHRIG